MTTKHPHPHPENDMTGYTALTYSFGTCEQGRAIHEANVRMACDLRQIGVKVVGEGSTDILGKIPFSCKHP